MTMQLTFPILYCISHLLCISYIALYISWLHIPYTFHITCSGLHVMYQHITHTIDMSYSCRIGMLNIRDMFAYQRYCGYLMIAESQCICRDSPDCRYRNNISDMQHDRYHIFILSIEWRVSVFVVTLL